MFTVYNKCTRTNYINKNRQKEKRKYRLCTEKNGTVKNISQAGLN